MATRYRRPGISATMTICSRTLTGIQSPAVQVADRQPFHLDYPKCKTNIPLWVDDLENNILIGFNVDPKRYTVRIHESTPPGQPCPVERELKTLNKDAGINQVVTGPYEVHFIPRDDHTVLTVEDLRAWQQRYAAVLADPALEPVKNTFVLCNSHTHSANLALDDLVSPPEGDVEKTLCLGLGLLSPQTLLRHNLGEALGLDLEEVDMRFHLGSEDCSTMRGIDELPTATSLATGAAVKLHLPATSHHGPNVNTPGDEDGQLESDLDETDDSE